MSDHQAAFSDVRKFNDKYPGRNIYLVFTKKKYLRFSLNTDDYFIIDYKKIRTNPICLDEVKYVVAHYMSMDKIDYIREQVTDEIEVIWDVYGYDLYNQFLETLGYNIFYKKNYEYSHYFLKRKFPSICKWTSSLFKEDVYSDKSIKEYFNYITNRVSSLLVRCETDALCLNLFIKKSIAYTLHIHSIMNENSKAAFNNGDNILVGNSASLSNNHLYALSYLNKLTINKGIVYVPLSYGGFTEYKNDIEQKYVSAFGDERVSILKQRLPRDEYFNIIHSCSVMIMSAWRQESLGNIMEGLRNGVKVFLSRKSPVYFTLKEKGFKVFALEDIKEGSLSPLSLEDKVYNYQKCVERYSEKNYNLVDEVFCI